MEVARNLEEGHQWMALEFQAAGKQEVEVRAQKAIQAWTNEKNSQIRGKKRKDS